MSEEYIILGNDAIVKCNVPSFVADFVSVESWVDSEGRDILRVESVVGNVSGDDPPVKLSQRKPHPKYQYWIWFSLTAKRVT